MWYNAMMVALLRSPLHGLISSGIMLVTYVGRKTGKRYNVPISYVRDEEDEDVLWTISLRKRTWWRNLRGGMEVTLRLRGRNRVATGEVLEGDEEVVEALGNFLQQARHYAKHFEVEFDAEGEPVYGHLIRASAQYLLIRFELTE
jgi:deazaflavin-dependent oxidoreductase (nitroreductase family)